MSGGSLPLPLLEPSSWELAPSTAVTPLAVVVDVGGPLRKFYDSLANTPGAVAWVDLEAFRGESIQARLRIEAAAAWLGAHQDVDVILSGGKTAEYDRVFGARRGLRLSAPGDVSAPTLEAWARAIDPELTIETAEALVRYAREFPEARVRPWDGLRFFAGFLRHARAEGALSFARGWAKAHALHSPQDEAAERLSLQRSETMLNPTAQLVTASRGIECFWRADGKLSQLELDPVSASLIDELHEGGRVPIAALVVKAAGPAKATPSEIEQRVGVLRERLLLL